MKEYRLKAWGSDFILNNNNGKFDRAAQEVGDKATPEAFLAAYDKLGGLILDKDKKKIDNGIFAARYDQWKEKQPQYIKTLEARENSLNEGEKRTVELIVKHLDHKRAFLGTLMTISSAVLAGLFILFTSKDMNGCVALLGKVSGFGFALFIVFASGYLTYHLFKESLSLDCFLNFIRNTKKDFISKIGNTIYDLNSYENYRKEKRKEEQKLISGDANPREGLFVIINSIFIFSVIAVFGLFLSASFNICIWF